MSLRGRTKVNDSDLPKRVAISLGRAAIPIDIVSLNHTVSWITGGHRDRWDVMVTPNLHHLRVLLRSPHLAEHYNGAALSIPDGWPVAWLASRLAGGRVERIAGQIVFQRLIDQPGKGVRLVLVGGTPGSELDALVDSCHRGGWQVSRERAPRAELTDPDLRAELVTRIASVGSGGIVVLGVGMPRQEELATEIAARPGAGTILCLGMSINFGSGAARPAPQVVQAMGLEWAFRVLQEPRRLFLRYARDSLVLPALLRLNRRRGS